LLTRNRAARAWRTVVVVSGFLPAAFPS